MTNKITGLLLAGVAALAFNIAATASPGKKGHDDNATKTVSETVTDEEADETLTSMEELTAEGAIKLPGRLVLPKMDPVRGKELFVSKGCVACHSVNGIGGEDAPQLDAHTMNEIMNPFDFAARMWRGAPAMIYAQQESMEEGQILFTGSELGDLAAFIHSDEVQHGFSTDDLTPEALEMLEGHAEGGHGEGDVNENDHTESDDHAD